MSIKTVKVPVFEVDAQRMRKGEFLYELNVAEVIEVDAEWAPYFDVAEDERVMRDKPSDIMPNSKHWCWLDWWTYYVQQSWDWEFYAIRIQRDIKESW